jgi:virginiamycin B lyase
MTTRMSTHRSRAYRPWLALTVPALVAPIPANALPRDPQTRVGTRRDGRPILAADVAHGAGKDFHRAEFVRDADLKGADLTGADLSEAVLEGVDLAGARLADADLTGAKLDGARLADADFTDSKARLAQLQSDMAMVASLYQELEAAQRADLPPQEHWTLADLLKGLAMTETLLHESLGALEQLPRPSRARVVEDRPQAAVGLEEPQGPLPDPPPLEWRNGPFEDKAAAADSWLEWNPDGFFSSRKPLGTLAEIATPAPVARLLAAEGGLAFTTAGSKVLRRISRTQVQSVALDSEPVDLGCTPEGTFWFTSRYEAPARMEYREFQWPSPDPGGAGKVEVARVVLGEAPAGAWAPFSTVRTGDGAIWWIGPERLFCRQPGSMEARRITFPGVTFTGLAAAPGNRCLYRSKAELGVVRLKGDELRQERAPAPDRGRAILGRQSCAWYAWPGHNAIVRAALTVPGQPAPARPHLVKLLGPQAEGGIFDLAEGPGGHIWFTEPGANAIGRFDIRTGQISRFYLPHPDSRPAFIVNGNDGNMYFTEEGGDRIGSIVAVDAEPPAASGQARKKTRKKLRKDPPKAPTTAAALPCPPPPGAACPSAPAPAEASPAEDDSGEEGAWPAGNAAQGAAPLPPAEPAPPPSRAAAAPAPPPQSFQDYPGALSSAGVAKVRWKHILDEHQYNAPNSKGQFLRDRSHVHGLAEFLYHAVKRPDYPLILDLEGRWVAMREFDRHVGYTWDVQTGKWRPTNRMKVVLSPRRDRIITAYPVARF